MDAGGGFLADTFPVFDDGGEPARAFLCAFLEESFDDLFFARSTRRIDPIAAAFHFVAFVEEQGGVAAVIHDQLRSFAAGVCERGECEFPIFFQRLALEGKNRNAGFGNRGGSLVLCAENIATGPAHRSAQLNQCLDEHGSLDGHVERTGDAHALEGLFQAVFGADRHEAGHFLFGHFNFAPAQISQRDVFYKTIVLGSHCTGWRKFNIAHSFQN